MGSMGWLVGLNLNLECGARSGRGDELKCVRPTILLGLHQRDVTIGLNCLPRLSDGQLSLAAQPAHDLARQLQHIAKPSAVDKSDMAAMAGLPQGDVLACLACLRQAAGWDKGVVVGIDNQGRDLQAGQMGQARGALPVVIRTVKAVQGSSEVLVEFV
jgi:hypothetical protein